MKRYLPEKKLPPYAFLPGYKPHPKSDPNGHSYNLPEKKSSKLNPYSPFECENYLYGIDLFNNGFYWEAHEEWEGVWNVHNKEGTQADFLKALIKICATGVKLRVSHFDGAKTHSITAKKMFDEIKEYTNEDFYAGLDLNLLTKFCMDIYNNTEKFKVDAKNNVEVIFDYFLDLN